LDLENIEKMQVEKYNEKAKASNAKAATASAELRVPKKRANAGGTDRGAPKKGHTAKYCKWCKAVSGSFTTHDTAECRRFEKDDSPKDRLVKPFDSVKKPWKKKSVSGSFTTHDTAESHRFEKDDSPKDRLVKPFDSVKKPWKKTGSGESNRMAYLTE